MKVHISCIAGTSSLVGCLLVVILLQILAAPAFAGHYTVVYSGGVASTPGNSYPYTTGSYGWGGSASYSGIGAFADASGQITATFIWVEDYAGEVPPLSAVVYETCTSRSASYYGINTTDDGFGDTSSSSYYSTQCSGTRGSVKSNPGTSFSITCSPSAHASGSMYGLMASVQYGAAASVVFVGLSGTLIGVPGNNILIGQGCNGYMWAGDISLSNFNWSVSGKTFKSFQVAPYSFEFGRLIQVPASTWASGAPHWYWSDSGLQNITCTATASINGVPIGQVTATTNATVWEPYYYIGHHVGDINYLDDQAGVQAGDGIGVKPGVKFLGAVGTQDLFKDYYGWAGIWQYVQLCKLSRTQYTWGNPFPFITNTDGEFMLDNKYPYEGWWLANSDSEDYPLQIGETEDNPSQDFIIHSVSIDVSDLFSMYMMYLPPGPDVQWVPLHRIDWGWTAQASYSGQMQSWIPVPPSGSVSVSRSQRWTDHPTWEHIYLNIGG